MKTMTMCLCAVVTAVSFSYCSPQSGGKERQQQGEKGVVNLSQYSRATFAAGCFWCEEAVFESIRGVAEVVSGYAGGSEKNSTYNEVGTGKTGHAEAVEVYYDSTVVDYPTLLRVFFASQDPTQVDGQGPDNGPQYRSIAFYRNPAERQSIEQAIAALTASGKYNKPIVTQVELFTEFWLAEEYHQDYVQQHPSNSYVQHESIPRLRRTQEQVRELVKPERSVLGK